MKMKPYTNPNGKAKWSLFWGDKLKGKMKKRLKKSARKIDKQVELLRMQHDYDRMVNLGHHSETGF